MNLAMLEFHNAKEHDWAHLLHEDDGKFHVISTKQPSGSRLSVIEVRWLIPGEEEGGDDVEKTKKSNNAPRVIQRVSYI